MRLLLVKLAGKALSPEQYELSEKKLVLPEPPSGTFELEIETEINPKVRLPLRTLKYKV